MDNLILTRLRKEDPIPFDLLLLADETKAAIEKYIHGSDIYVLSAEGNAGPVGVVALYKINDAEIEIKNIAIRESWQGRGIGSFLLDEVKEIARHEGYEHIIVGTPDVAAKEISFYEKNGFRKYGLKKNFFRDNYPEPIIEDGIVLKDMVMLKHTLYSGATSS